MMVLNSFRTTVRFGSFSFMRVGFSAMCLAIAGGLLSTTAMGQLRPEWIAGKITGSPEPPPPFQQVRRFPNLQFDQPLAIERDPANARLWVITRKAKIYSFPDKNDIQTADLFVDLQAEFKNLIPLEDSTKTGSAFSIAFHPQYPLVPYCWITYTMKKADWRDHLEQGTRLSRFRIDFHDGIPKCDVSSERLVLSWLEGGHNGGALRFGPDGYLYVSAGDGEVPNPPDPRRAGQDVTNQLSTILRIDVHTDDARPAYSVPEDNPFTKSSLANKGDDASGSPAVSGSQNDFSAAEAMPEIWAYGFRNPWKMNFDERGRLWVGDVGWELYEMVHNVTKGGNYGWSLFEGTQPLLSGGKRGPTAVLPAAMVYHHSEGASVTGGFVYRGKLFPELTGQYVFGDYETRRIWASKVIEGRDPGQATLLGLDDLTEPSVRIVAFGEDSKNELLLVHMDEGTIYGLQRSESSSSRVAFPIRLSETGLFKNVSMQEPETGVREFEINEPMSTGDTNAVRWIALAGRSPGQVLKKGRRRDNSPLRDRIVVEPDSVAVRTVSKTDVAGRSVHLETQILHFNGKVWNPYSYVWRSDQTDATLVPASGAVLDLKPYGSFSSKQPYRIHSRSECIRCHNSWVGGLLAFSLPQLNRAVTLQTAKTRGLSSGTAIATVNQLQLFRKIGLLKGAIPGDPAATEEPHCQALVSSRNEAADIDRRVRSYLDVNCAHCHQNGAGGTATIDLRFQALLPETKLIDAPPMQGTFGIDDPRIVTPGMPERSVLLYRMACEGRGHMPHLGSDSVDGRAVNLVTEWIYSLGTPPVTERSRSITSTSNALRLASEWDQAGLSKAEASEILKQARQSSTEIQNLFTRFQPEQYRTIRRVPDPIAILGLNGNGSAGEAVFRNPSLQCTTCHQVNEKGGQVGPALDKNSVTSQTKAQLLDSLLNPSKTIDEKFAAWTAITRSGKIVTGLLKGQSDSQITLVTSKNESVTIARDRLEELVQQETSLMPDRILDGITDQQIADLLAWLKSQPNR